MDITEAAVLLAARNSSRKSDIVQGALARLSDNSIGHRGVLGIVDNLVGAGLMRQKSLGVYELEPEGEKAVQGMLPLLETISSEIRYGRLG